MTHFGVNCQGNAALTPESLFSYKLRQLAKITVDENHTILSILSVDLFSVSDFENPRKMTVGEKKCIWDKIRFFFLNDSIIMLLGQISVIRLKNHPRLVTWRKKRSLIRGYRVTSPVDNRILLYDCDRSVTRDD